MTRLIYVANNKRQCGRCHKTFTWRCGVVGKTAHPIACYSCVWHHGLPHNWMREYLDAAEQAVAPGVPSYTPSFEPDDDVPF